MLLVPCMTFVLNFFRLQVMVFGVLFKLLVPFLADVRKAYITTAVYLQKKLPLASPTLTALSALDPLLKGHSQATIQLKR